MAGFANVAFMDTPLVTWVQTFCEGREPISYKELCDGAFLNNHVMHEIDPRALEVAAGTTVEDRINTWDVLMKNIKAYYQDVLQQYIVMRLPNVNTICRDSESEKARKEVQRVLLLILGCAVQCERKEEFIGNIKLLDIGIQHAIVENIQEITDNNKNVFAIELPEEQQDELSQCLFTHLTSLIRERDGYIQEMKDMSQTVEELYIAQQQSEAMKAALTAPTVSTTPEKQQHSNVELAETKAKLRKLRQEYEEKSEAVSELMEELDEARTQLNKLRSENSELLQDARSARAYRDELDVYKEKASRVDKYETEINKYKDKLNELEFFKARVEELREDNGILVETKIMLEDQLSQKQKRIDTVVELETELLRLRQHVDELTADRDAQRHRLQEVLEENARLEFEKKSSFNESATLEEELVKAKTQLHEGITNSLSAQLGETANAKILRLELENQRLQKQLNDNRQNAVVDQASRMLELEKENHRLAKKVEKLQETFSKEHDENLQQVVNIADVQRQKIEVEKTLETVKESSERQIRELEREKEMLESTVESLRERNEKTFDFRIQDIEKENQKLHQRVKEATSDFSRIEYENRQLLKSQERNKENILKVQRLEDDNQKLENMCEEFKKNITTLKLTCDNYEKLENQASDLEVDNQKMSKTIERLKESVSRLQEAEQLNINLTVENQALKRSSENQKQSSSKLVAAEQEKEELAHELQQVRRQVEGLREVQSKHEQLEMDLLEMDTENQRLQRSLEAKTRHVEELEHDILDLEKQVENLNKDLESSRVAIRRLETVELERHTLEQDAATTTRQKAALDKENKRLKQAAEMRAATIDELTTQAKGLEKENREYLKQVERNKDALSRLHELERENLELAQQAGVDKRTVVTLREDLVNEKIRSQQLSNDLEKLNYDLEKVGIKKEKLALVQDASGPISDESKFQALEGLMQEALTKKMELKDEKIQTLQSRLEESVSRNQRLQEELTGVRRELAILEQRREEDALQLKSAQQLHATGYAQKPSQSAVTPPREKPIPPPKPVMTQSATKDILELKDHLITVERKNASLETENKNLHSHLDQLQQRLRHSESQTIAAQEELAKHQHQFHALQSQLAKMQVESTTYQAQNSSLQSQNQKLQQQHTELEAEHNRLSTVCHELRTTHESLVVDHDSLQHLHEQLTTEYEALISEHGSLKANHKQLRNELREQQEQSSELRREKQTISELKYSIEQDREALKTETKSLGNLQVDYKHVKQENHLLKSTHEKLSREYSDLTAEHKVIKAEYNQLQLKFTSQQGQLSEARNQLNMCDVDTSKLASKCEMLSSLNTKLEEENRTLMMQLQALLNQNQELLTQVMDSKDHFHEEERAYMEKLSELRRQKEKLEEKIMEQFKRYDPVKKKNRGFRANFVRKARGMFNRNRSRERPQTMDGSEMFPHDSAENSSMGSGSMGDNNESPSERIRNKKQRSISSSDLLDSPKLARQNKALAQSTTALNMMRSKPAAFGLRGAKSSENLLATVESPRSSRRDNDSMSSENSASRNQEWPSRPPRRRHLLDSSGHNLSVYHGSQSSEDTTRDNGEKKENRDEDNDDSIDGDDDDDDLISLNQFLNESNRSPKARRKLLISKNIDPEEIKKEAIETAPEPPPKFLTPRPPVIEPDPSKPKTPKSMRKGHMSGAKSEMNLSTLSKQTSGSSMASFANTHGLDLKTSTPKQPVSGFNGGYSGRREYMHERGLSNGSQGSDRLGASGHSEPGSTNTNGPVYATVRSSTSAYNLGQRAAEYNGYERDRGEAPRGPGGYTDRYGRDIGMGQRNGPPREENPYTPMSRSNTNTHSLPRQSSLPQQQQQGYMSMEGKRPSTSNPPNNGYGDSLSSSWGGPQQHPHSQQQQSRQHQPEGSSSTTNDKSYMPGNVRNLVQNFHMTVQTPPTNGGSSGNGVGGHQPPVPPPRRSRPLSAGGNLGSGGGGGNMGGSGSAFSTPRPQSAVPAGYGHHPHHHGNNNNNNFSPAEAENNKPQVARPGSTPPRPAPTGREGAPKNALWYEYGCV